MISTTFAQLPLATQLSGAESIPIDCPNGDGTFTTRKTSVGAVAQFLVSGAPFLTLGSNAGLVSSRRLITTPADIVLTDGGIGSTATLSLATAGTAGSYGDASHVLAFTVDTKGRVTAVTSNALVVGNVSGAAPLASPAFTGTPTAPTASLADNSAALATTAYVQGQGYVTTATAPVTSFNTRTGAIALATGDVTGVLASGLPIVNGGTGATTAAAALGNLGLNSQGQVGSRNWLRNGNFSINQRRVSGTVTLAAGAYGHDAWKAGASGCTYTFATSASGDTTLTISAGTLLQVIEGALSVKSTTAIVSNAGTAQVRVFQGAATGSYVATPLAVTGLTAGTNTTVEFSTGTLTLSQCEPGTTATSFEYRSDEQSRCEWTCRVFGGNDAFEFFESGQVGSATSMVVILPLRNRMRANPAVSFASAANFAAISGGSLHTATALATTHPTVDAIDVTVTTTSLTTGQSGTLQANNSTAALITVSADL